MNIFLIDINKSIVLQRILLLIVFLISLFFLFSLEHTAKPFTKDGVHFQKWSSDTMFQCLNSSCLRKHPFKSLWFLHQEPPLYDTIRDLIVGSLQKTPDKSLSLRLDQCIYVLYAFCYAAMATLLYYWLSRMTNLQFAFYLSMAWVLHPSPVYYATYLDPTFLISLGVLWFSYELWLFYSNSGSMVRLSISVILLFYLRNTFDWHFIILLALCLMLMKIPRRQYLKFMIICVLFIAPYIIKQYALFKVTNSTQLGHNFYFLVAGDYPYEKRLTKIESSIPWTYPKEATLSVGHYNTEECWRENFAFYKLAGQYLRAYPNQSRKNVAYTFLVYNWPYYWQPSSTFRPNTAVLLLPWNNVLNQYLSYPANFLILVFAFLLWRKSRLGAGLPLVDRRILGLILPLVYIFLSSTLVNSDGNGWTEAVRYKFFLEPVYYVFIASQLYGLLKWEYDDTSSIPPSKSINISSCK